MNNLPIRFRAWQKPIIDGDDSYGSEMHYAEEGDEKRFVSFGFYADSGWSFDDYIFMESAYEIDKNDKEVYEGDILRYGEVMLVVVRTGSQWLATSEYMNSDLSTMLQVGAIVVGNIYENSDLV